MKIAYLQDIHLDNRQYGLISREQDFYDVFLRIVDDIIDKNIKYVLIGGDIFENRSPKPIAIQHAVNGIKKLKENNILTYAIIGNHSLNKSKSGLSPVCLLDITILNSDTYTIIDDVFVCGLRYHDSYEEEDFRSKLDKLSKLAENYKYSIIMLHQGWVEELKIGAEFSADIIPEVFDLVLTGHLHKHYDFKNGNTRVFSQGSTEISSKTEIVNYKKHGKGYAIIDTKDLNIQRINIDLNRDFYIYKIDYNILEKELKKIKEEISKDSVLHLEVYGEKLDAIETHKLVNKVITNTLITKTETTQLETPISNFDEESKDGIIPTIKDYIKDSTKYNDFQKNTMLKILNLSSLSKEDGTELFSDIYGNYKESLDRHKGKEDGEKIG